MQTGINSCHLPALRSIQIGQAEKSNIENISWKKHSINVRIRGLVRDLLKCVPHIFSITS